MITARRSTGTLLAAMLVTASVANAADSLPAGTTVQTFGNWSVTISPAPPTNAIMVPASPQILPAPAPPKDVAASTLTTPSVTETSAPQTTLPPDAISLLPPSPVPVVPPKPSTVPDATAPELATILPCSGCDGMTGGNGLSKAEAYRAVYESIPFSRVEYDANPSYRHDATIELLLGQVRPVTRNTTNVTVNNSTGGFPYGGGYGYNWPYSYYYSRYRTFVRF